MKLSLTIFFLIISLYSQAIITQHLETAMGDSPNKLLRINIHMKEQFNYVNFHSKIFLPSCLLLRDWLLQR